MTSLWQRCLTPPTSPKLQQRLGRSTKLTLRSTPGALRRRQSRHTRKDQWYRTYPPDPPSPSPYPPHRNPPTSLPVDAVATAPYFATVDSYPGPSSDLSSSPVFPPLTGKFSSMPPRTPNPTHIWTLTPNLILTLTPTLAPTLTPRRPQVTPLPLLGIVAMIQTG